MLRSILDKFNSKITHIHVLTACCITFLAITILGCIAPYFPLSIRKELAYATGWIVECSFLLPLYLAIKDWRLINKITSYLITTGTLLLALMYSLWLFANYGDHYPQISACGFNIATEYFVIAICSLIIMIYAQHRHIVRLTEKLTLLNSETKG